MVDLNFLFQPVRVMRIQAMNLSCTCTSTLPTWHSAVNDSVGVAVIWSPNCSNNSYLNWLQHIHWRAGPSMLIKDVETERFGVCWITKYCGMSNPSNRIRPIKLGTSTDLACRWDLLLALCVASTEVLPKSIESTSKDFTLSFFCLCVELLASLWLLTGLLQLRLTADRHYFGTLPFHVTSSLPLLFGLPFLSFAKQIGPIW